MIKTEQTPRIYSFVREREIDYAEGNHSVSYQQALNSRTELLEKLDAIRKKGISFAKNYIAMRERFAVDDVVVSVHDELISAKTKVKYLFKIDILDSSGAKNLKLLKC